MNIIRGFVSILGSKVGALILGIIITPFLVRYLGSSLYGDYAFLVSILGITMILANAGIFDGIRKYIAENKDDPEWTGYVFGFYVQVAGFFALLAATIFVVIAWLGLTERFLGTEFKRYFYLLGLLVVVRQANSVARGGLMGLGLENRSEPLIVLEKLLFGISAVSLLYLGYGIAGVLAGHVLAAISSAGIGFLFLFQRIDVSSVFTRIPRDFPKKELVSFNGFSVILILLTASLYHVDILFLRLITGDQATGYYRAALVVAEFLWFVPNALQTVLLHSSSELWSEDRTDQITELSSRTTRYNLSLVLLLAIGLTALANDFIPLYFGPEFEASIGPFLLLLPGVIGFALARPMFAIGQGKGELRVLIGATGVAALINILLNALLIPTYGMFGAAIATSIGYGIMVILHTLAARQIGFDPIDDLRLGQILIVAAVSATIILGTAELVESSILSLIIVPPLGFVTYTILSFRLGVVTPGELDSLISQLPNPVHRYLKRLIQFIT